MPEKEYFNHIDETWEEYSARVGESADESGWNASVTERRKKAFYEYMARNPPRPNPNAPAGEDRGGLPVRDPDDRSPASFEERLAYGEFEGEEGRSIELEARRRRKIFGQDALPADVADVVSRDASGRVRAARSSTTLGSLGQSFSPRDSMFGGGR